MSVRFLLPGWTELFISELEALSPLLPHLQGYSVSAKTPAPPSVYFKV